jgi:hypothetical protein
MIQLAEIELPDFGLPDVEPTIPPKTYEARIAVARQLAKDMPFDVLMVYGDREHFANLAYLTGYDPRFEEALLLLVPDRVPILLVGNEGMGYASLIPIEIERVLFQSFSLISQPRSSSQPLKTIFQNAGIKTEQSIGVVGWKYFEQAETDGMGNSWTELPAYIVDTLRNMGGEVYNCTDLFMYAQSGLRAINDVDQLAQFEFAATHTSQAVKNVVFGARPGMTEYDAVRLMQLNGMPWSVHLMLSSGQRAFVGLPSPSMKTIQHGDAMTAAYGLWGALNCRAGFMVSDANELPENIRDYVEKLVIPYFGAIVDWYQHIGIGVTGGELYDIVHKHLDDPFFGVSLNPGHLIHLDEWVSSPIYKDSTEKLVSGMAIQVDVIPATGTPYFTTNIEDGIALADERLREEFSARYPGAWRRIQQRREFMQEQLGITLKPEVLPFSNIPAYLPPFWLSPTRVTVNR